MNFCQNLYETFCQKSFLPDFEFARKEKCKVQFDDCNLTSQIHRQMSRHLHHIVHLQA